MLEDLRVLVPTLIKRFRGGSAISWARGEAYLRTAMVQHLPFVVLFSVALLVSCGRLRRAGKDPEMEDVETLAENAERAGECAS